MKITKSYLRQIIKEEIESISGQEQLNEGWLKDTLIATILSISFIGGMKKLVDNDIETFNKVVPIVAQQEGLNDMTNDQLEKKAIDLIKQKPNIYRANAFEKFSFGLDRVKGNEQETHKYLIGVVVSNSPNYSKALETVRSQN